MQGYISLLYMMCALVIVVFGYWWDFGQWNEIKETSIKYQLIVGILSSRENFERRSVIRKYLNKSLNANSSVLVKFIVGRTACKLPMEERLDPYECKQDSFVKPYQEFYYSHQLQLNDQLNNQLNYQLKEKSKMELNNVIGFDFKVNHDIFLDELGVGVHNFSNGFIKVTLYDTVLKTAVASCLFTSFSKGRWFSGYHYKNVEKQLLREGFIGSIVIDGFPTELPVTILKHSSCLISDGDGLITIKKGYRYGFNLDEFPDHFNLRVDQPCYHASTAFKFSSTEHSLTDNDSEISLAKLANYNKWMEHLADERNHLDNEIELYNDILLVDTVEVYRNLPIKMLLFYQLLMNTNFEFVMKTDDDCYINLPDILKMLEEMKVIGTGTDHLWIGNFRLNFGIDTHGKWAEHEYHSISYPPFACGSGYILSNNLVMWLATNADSLNIYQGEDTSLGIWMAALKHQRIHEPRFQCSKFTNDIDLNSFTIPENDLPDMHLLYERDHVI